MAVGGSTSMSSALTLPFSGASGSLRAFVLGAQAPRLLTINSNLGINRLAQFASRGLLRSQYLSLFQ